MIFHCEKVGKSLLPWEVIQPPFAVSSLACPQVSIALITLF